MLLAFKDIAQICAENSYVLIGGREIARKTTNGVIAGPLLRQCLKITYDLEEYLGNPKISYKRKAKRSEILFTKLSKYNPIAARQTALICILQIAINLYARAGWAI